MKKGKKKSGSNSIVRNKKAGFNYQIFEKYEAGIELKGCEVKSVRAGKVNIAESYIKIEGGQVFLYKCNIAEYESASSWDDYSVTRNRRLLLHKKEIDKLIGEYAQKGMALVPIDMHWRNGKVKVQIGVGKGKVKSDKRHDLREKAEKRDVARTTAYKIKGV